MLWYDRALYHREDFVDAMQGLQDEHEAAKFRAIFTNAFGKPAEKLLGYLVQHCHSSEIERLRKFFDLEHPTHEHTEEFGCAPVKRLHPDVVDLLMAIPKRDPR